MTEASFEFSLDSRAVAQPWRKAYPASTMEAGA